MATIERDVVLMGRDGENTTIDLPITRLGNIEPTSEDKSDVVDADMIPLLDSADAKTMKKISWSAIVAKLKKSISASDIGADSAGSSAAVQENLTSHISDKNNPHGVDAEDVGTYPAEKIMASTVPPMFGLGSEAVPSDILALLGRYNFYWWETDKKSTGTIETDEITEIFSADSSARGTISYSDSVTVDPETLKVSLSGNVQTLSLYWEESKKAEALIGKYFIPYLSEAPADFVCYMKPDTPPSSIDSFNKGTGFDRLVIRISSTYCHKVIGKASSGEKGFVNSQNRSEYPDNGELNGTYYRFLGVPFEHAVSSGKISIGSYIGTGTYGTGNPTKIPMNGKMSFLIIRCAKSGAPSNTLGSIGIATGLSDFIGFYRIASSPSFDDIPIKVTENGVEITASAVHTQFNVSGCIYEYFGISN